MNNENNKINDDFEMIENSNMNLKLKKQFFSKKYDWNNYGYSIINNPYVLYDNFPKQKKYINILNNVIFNEGVSNKIRPKMYLNLTGAKMEKENHKNYYFNLINNFPKNIPNKFLNIIEADLNRTFIENEYFHNEKNLNKLKNILLAYSRRNSKIGYCQGFNFIVGKLLLIFDYENNENNNKINENKINENKINENKINENKINENKINENYNENLEIEENVFWVFTQILEKILPNEYYNDFFGLMNDINCFIVLLKDYYHKNNHELKFLNNQNNEVLLNTVFFKWFETLFIDGLNENLTFFIWDALIINGDLILFKSALAIFEFIKKDILNIKFEEIANFFEEKLKYVKIDRKKFYNFVLFDKFKIDIKKFKQIRRTNLENGIKKLVNKNNKINENKINENKINENNNKIINENNQIEECNRNWPFCTQKSKDEINEVLILKVFNQTNIIKNFFENQNKIKNFDKENNKNIYNNLLILREKHECKKNSSLIIDKDENLNKYNRKLTKVLITNKKIKEKQNFNILKDSMIVINNFFMENEKINENKIENEE
jgi:hypothetical protein